MNLILGFDPGQSGGVAWQVIGNRQSASAISMPKTEHDLRHLLKGILDSHEGDALAFIEKVGATPQMGACSSFTFGKSYGFLRGVLTGMAIPFEEVTPQRWQADFNLKMKGKKLGKKDTEKHNHIKSKAQSMFPWLDVTHAKAAALLICEYGARQHRAALTPSPATTA